MCGVRSGSSDRLARRDRATPQIARELDLHVASLSGPTAVGGSLRGPSTRSRMSALREKIGDRSACLDNLAGEVATAEEGGRANDSGLTIRPRPVVSTPCERRSIANSTLASQLTWTIRHTISPARLAPYQQRRRRRMSGRAERSRSRSNTSPTPRPRRSAMTPHGFAPGDRRPPARPASSWSVSLAKSRTARRNQDAVWISFRSE